MNACQAARNEMRNLAGQPSTRIAAIEGATRNEGAATVATIGLRSRQHTALPLIRACDQFVDPISIQHRSIVAFDRRRRRRDRGDRLTRAAARMRAARQFMD